MPRYGQHPEKTGQSVDSRSPNDRHVPKQVSRQKPVKTGDGAQGARGRPGSQRVVIVERRPGRSPDMTALPNIVLVHGAWADGSSWSAVIEHL